MKIKQLFLLALLLLVACTQGFANSTPPKVSVSINNQTGVNIDHFSITKNNNICCQAALPNKYLYSCGASCGDTTFNAVVIINETETCNPFRGGYLSVSPKNSSRINVYKKGDFNCTQKYCCSVAEGSLFLSQTTKFIMTN